MWYVRSIGNGILISAHAELNRAIAIALDHRHCVIYYCDRFPVIEVTLGGRVSLLQRQTIGS